jgi:hypothetical protein
MQLLQKVHAQAATTIDSGIGPDIGTLGQLFAFILNIILGAGFALVLIMLAMGFVQYIMSQGDKAGVEKAQKWVTYAVVGGIGLFLVYVLRTVMQQVTGGQITDETVGSGLTL